MGNRFIEKRTLIYTEKKGLSRVGVKRIMSNDCIKISVTCYALLPHWSSSLSSYFQIWGEGIVFIKLFILTLLIMKNYKQTKYIIVERLIYWVVIQ